MSNKIDISRFSCFTSKSHDDSFNSLLAKLDKEESDIHSFLTTTRLKNFLRGTLESGELERVEKYLEESLIYRQIIEGMKLMEEDMGDNAENFILEIKEEIQVITNNFKEKSSK